MTYQSTLEKLARDRTQFALDRAAVLAREITEIEAQLALQKAARDFAVAAKMRFETYQARIGNDYQCPSCWIEHERNSSLHAMGGGTDTTDFFRCHSCSEEFEFPFR